MLSNLTPILYLITDDLRRDGKEFHRILQQAIEGGVNLVQFREKSLRGIELEKHYMSIYRLCEDFGIPLLLNSDLIDYLTSGCPVTGIHFNKKSIERFSQSYPYRTSGLNNNFDGYSAHSVEEGVEVTNKGIPFCTLSPIFDTPSKQGILPAIGIEPIREFKLRSPKSKIIALGGIDKRNALECMNAGADGIAVMRAICSADNPKKAAAELWEIIKNR